MPYPMTWSSGLTISGSDWNDVRLYKAADYVVFRENNIYYAYGQNSGSTDYSGSVASTVIQNALNSFGSAGGIIKLLKGTYPINTSISLRTSSAIIGSGRGTVLQVTVASSINTLYINGNNQCCLISNLLIDGNSQDSKGVYIYNSTGSKVLNCWFENFWSNPLNISNGTNNIVYGNNITGSISTAISLTGNENIISTNIIFKHSGYAIGLTGKKNVISDNIITTAGGIYLVNADHNEITRNSISNCISEAIIINDSDFNTIEANNLDSNTTTTNNTYNEIYITGSSTFNTINSNTVCSAGTNRAKYGIRESQESDYNLFIGNIVSGSATANISIQGSHSKSGSDVNIC